MIKERLRLVAGNIIDAAQVGFMQDRLIGENIIGTLDLIEYAHIHDIPAALIAIDFHKAFDVIERNSLYYLLLLITLHEHLVNLLFNSGWSRKYFIPTRGLFQGTCSAPLLYNIVSQALLCKILNNSSIQGVSVCNTFTGKTRT